MEFLTCLSPQLFLASTHRIASYSSYAVVIAMMLSHRLPVNCFLTFSLYLLYHFNTLCNTWSVFSAGPALPLNVSGVSVCPLKSFSTQIWVACITQVLWSLCFCAPAGDWRTAEERDLPFSLLGHRLAVFY